MPSIQSSAHPLVFRVDSTAQMGRMPIAAAPATFRTVTRALQGMQKEAIVHNCVTNHGWRMVSDEGPYLNGTDLAPFPLAFFTTGMAATFMEEILSLSKQRGVALRSLELVLDNRYSMEGSALNGTMTGSALPVDLEVRIKTDADKKTINNMIHAAISASPANGLLREVLVNRFTVTSNGKVITLGRVAALDDVTTRDPRNIFDAVHPDPPADTPIDIITKVSTTETLFGVEGGAGSSLAAEQKRELHVRGTCRIREDGIKEISTQLHKPIGSVFQFLSDNSSQFGGQGRAPSGLDYLSAGIAFCYMTQLGRYATIVKKPLDDYRIVQDTSFSLPGASGRAGVAATAYPVETHVFVESSEGDDFTRQLVDMGEQTCFLHAACRLEVKSRIRIRLL